MPTRITMQLVRAAKPRAKPYEIRDTQARGLILRVQPSGRKTYYCQPSRAKRIKIGRTDLLTLTQARTRCLEILGQAARGEDMGAAPDPKLGDYARGQYRDWCLAHLKSGTMDPDRLVSRFADLLDKRLSKITPELVEAWVLRRLNDGRSAHTLRRDVAVLRSALRKAVRWSLIPKDPLAGMRVIQAAGNARVRYLSDPERDRLLAAVDGSRIKPIVLLALNTGLRRGELLALKWEDIDMDQRQVTITSDSAKSRKARHIPLNGKALEALPPPGTGRLFSISIWALRREWRRVLKDAQIQGFRFHDLRHDFASRLVMRGVDLNTVRELLGHADIKMTLRYAHLSPGHRRAAVDLL
jgi:integrase